MYLYTYNVYPCTYNMYSYTNKDAPIYLCSYSLIPLCTYVRMNICTYALMDL